MKWLVIFLVQPILRYTDTILGDAVLMFLRRCESLPQRRDHFCKPEPVQALEEDIPNARYCERDGGDLLPAVVQRLKELVRGDAAVHEPHREEGQQQEDAVDELEGAACAVHLVEGPVDVEEECARLPQQTTRCVIRQERLKRKQVYR